MRDEYIITAPVSLINTCVGLTLLFSLGIPTPEVAWLVNGRPAVTGQGIELTNNNYHLTLQSAQVLDSAVYTCVASNTAGELRKKFELEVQGIKVLLEFILSSLLTCKIQSTSNMRPPVLSHLFRNNLFITPVCMWTCRWFWCFSNFWCYKITECVVTWKLFISTTDQSPLRDHFLKRSFS